MRTAHEANYIKYSLVMNKHPDKEISFADMVQQLVNQNAMLRPVNISEIFIREQQKPTFVRNLV